MASIPGHGMTPPLFVILLVTCSLGIDKEVEEDAGDIAPPALFGDIGAEEELRKLDNPGIVNIVDPPCNQVVSGISLAELTS